MIALLECFDVIIYLNKLIGVVQCIAAGMVTIL